MATIIEAPHKKDFVPHPEGSFVAVLRDAYLEERDNPWKGKPRDKDDPSKGIDTRDKITEIHMEFLTEHLVNIGGKMLPAYAKYKASASLAENANLRKFIQGWFPQLKEDDFKRFDADKLIGRGAYITIKHNESKGNIYANVIGAMQPPKGSKLPAIPNDFVRHQPKPDQVTNDPVERYDTVDSIRQGKSADIGGDKSIMPPVPPLSDYDEMDAPPF